MSVREPDRVETIYVDAAADAAEPGPLADADDRLTVTALADRAAAKRRLRSERADCLVVACRTGEDPALSLVEWADERLDLPVIVFTDGVSGIAEAALAAGATDCVVAGGTDGPAVLAERVWTAADHARTVADLRATEARFEALTRNTSFAVVTMDEDSVVQYASDAVEDLFGYAPDELVGAPLTEIMPDRFHESHSEAVSRYLETGERALDWDWIELPGRHRDGTEIPLGVSFGEREAEDGHLFTGIVRDISDRKAREERLDRLASAVEASMDGVAILDDDGRYTYVNDAHAAVYGYDDADELVGESWRCLYDDSEVDRFEREIMPQLREQGQWRGEATGLRADDSTFPQELSLTELDDGGIVCVVRDVTARVERRRELESERNFVESVVDALPDVFYVLDAEGCLDQWNDRMEEVTGYTSDELSGIDALELIPPEDHELIAQSIHSILAHDEPRTPRSALVSKQGDRTPYEFSGSRLTGADGEVIGLTGIGRDITDEQLREQRLAVLSRVLRHNVRNRLNVVTGRADHIADTADDPDVAESASRILDAAWRLSRVSERAHRAESLLRARGETTTADLANVVRQGIADADVPTDGVRVSVPDRTTAVAPQTVELAVAELVENAVEHADDHSPTVAVERSEETVDVIVRDDGPGLPANERTVLDGELETDLEHGTGVGLWLVRWVVAGAGGQVSVREPPDGGTAVVLSFPAA